MLDQPSIQSFYGRVSHSGLRSPSKTTSSSPPRLGGGFTSQEASAFISSTSSRDWSPKGEYAPTDIDAISPGPGCVMINGRVVNLTKKPWTRSQSSGMRASGYIKMVIRDDTGIIVVKFFYARVVLPIRLGALVRVWTPHVSINDPKAPSQHDGLYVSVFPERDNSCHVELEEETIDSVICKRPLGYNGKTLPELMTLENFTGGGHEIRDCKILVCVKSIGQRKRFTFKKDSQDKVAEILEIVVLDDTFEAILSLWADTIDSATTWKPSSTVLLVTNPGWKGTTKGKGKIRINPSTYIDVDPDMYDASWLRNHAQRMAKKDHVNPLFPNEAFDVPYFESSPNRIKYTLADIDEFVRAGPIETFMGYFSLHITELQVAKLHLRNMMCSTECCGVPIFANAAQASCKQCDQEVILRPNPRIVGQLSDETGSVNGGKLVWAEEAWKLLLGRSTQELVAEPPQTLKNLEYQMKNVRVTLLMGWSPEVGKLAVCKAAIAMRSCILDASALDTFISAEMAA